MELEESDATSISTEQTSNAAEYDLRIATDTAPRAYRSQPRRPGQSNFMDFFTPRRRPPVDQNVPIYKALTRRPADLCESESPIVAAVQEASSDQSAEETVSHDKALTGPIAAACN
jgi:hypothetical protein